MIGYLCGKAKAPDLVICNGVGYKVFTPAVLKDGEDVELSVVTVVREDAFELYGFPTAAEEELFKILIKVKGVGGKFAISMMSQLGASEVARAIAATDAKALAKSKGVGPKLAQTLCVAASIPDTLLADLGAVGAAAPAESTALDDVAQALVSLGYPPAQAAEASAFARRELGDVDEGKLIRAALGSIAPTAIGI